MDNHKYCVIMAGGTGNSLWPLTRESKPKQFLKLGNNSESLLKMTFDRFSRIIPAENIYVVTLSRFGEMTMNEIPNLKKENLLLEPYSRGTAPCIAYATYTILKRDPEAVMVVSPADHIIKETDIFDKTMDAILDYAGKNKALMTLGIYPSRPETSFGYIQISGGKNNKTIPMKVKTFTEKPDMELAKVFCRSGEFYWNSGIYTWQAKVIKEEMERYIPEVTSLFTGWENLIGSDRERYFLETIYASCSNLSIDYGVMEKTEIAWLYPASFTWSDIENWDSLYNSISLKDENDNVISKHHLTESVNKCLVFSENKNKLIAIKGLKDYLVIDRDDVLLICPKNDKEFKSLISDIAMPDYEEYR